MALDPTAAATVTAVETAAKTDVAKVTSVIQADIAKIRADYAALQAKTFHWGAVLIAAGGGLVAGLLAHLL